MEKSVLNFQYDAIKEEKVIVEEIVEEEILEDSEMEETTEAHDLEIAQLLELNADAQTVKVPAVGEVVNETKVVEEAAPVEETKEEIPIVVIEEEEIDTNADLMCKDGSETCYVAQADIAVIYIDQTNWVKNFDGENKFSIDGALTKIYYKLNKYYFYQIRESIIVNRDVIISWERFKPAQFKLKLKVKIIINGIEEEIIVSQGFAIGFKKWYDRKQ